MVDVTLVPANGFGWVPTPALVAPVEFTMRAEDYVALGGHVDRVRPVEVVLAEARQVVQAPRLGAPWPLTPPR